VSPCRIVAGGGCCTMRQSTRLAGGAASGYPRVVRRRELRGHPAAAIFAVEGCQ